MLSYASARSTALSLFLSKSSLDNKVRRHGLSEGLRSSADSPFLKAAHTRTKMGTSAAGLKSASIFLAKNSVCHARQTLLARAFPCVIQGHAQAETAHLVLRSSYRSALVRTGHWLSPHSSLYACSFKSALQQTHLALRHPLIACALFNNWLPILVALTFVLAPLPNALVSWCAGAEDFTTDNKSVALCPASTVLCGPPRHTHSQITNQPDSFVSFSQRCTRLWIFHHRCHRRHWLYITPRLVQRRHHTSPGVLDEHDRRRTRIRNQ